MNETHLLGNFQDFFLHVEQTRGLPVQKLVLFLNFGKPLVLLEHHPESQADAGTLVEDCWPTRTQISAFRTHQLRAPQAASDNKHIKLLTSKLDDVLFAAAPLPASVFTL